jgi:hypothetical protein
MPKRSRSGLVSMPARVVAPTRVKGRQIKFDRARCRAFANHDVELEVLHCRIQHFFDDRRQSMDFIDEQHIARFQIGQQRRQIAGALEYRAGGALDRNTHFLGDDIGQSGLAQARRPEDQGVIQRFLRPRAA